ncbi:RAI1 protein [Rutstroemia sp. NJR-2017a BBW]|nr:RAI1 protein [Rutstroemia sp. NJR-2017a BBW]
MSHVFDIQPIGRFVGSSAAIRRPREIACFSYDDNHQFRLDDSSIRYYYPPYLGADLSKGFDTFKKLDDEADDHLDSLLKTIINYEQKEGKKVEVDVVTWRGMMTKFMAAIFADRDGFEMNATLFQNHEYKLKSHARQSASRPAPGRPSQDMMSFWVNNHAQYCSIVRTGIGNTVMILGGEVDAVWDVKPTEDIPIKWVELKTSQDIQSDRDMVTFERKLMKFWIQSFLLGVPKIIVGFRTPDGILKRIEELDTASIPSTEEEPGTGTCASILRLPYLIVGASHSLTFHDMCLTTAVLKATITGDGVWRIRRREKTSTIEVFKVEETGHGDILSDEFINWRIKLSMKETPTSEEVDPRPAENISHSHENNS